MNEVSEEQIEKAVSDFKKALEMFNIPELFLIQAAIMNVLQDKVEKEQSKGETNQA